MTEIHKDSSVPYVIVDGEVFWSAGDIVNGLLSTGEHGVQTGIETRSQAMLFQGVGILGPALTLRDELSDISEQHGLADVDTLDAVRLDTAVTRQTLTCYLQGKPLPAEPTSVDELLEQIFESEN